MCIGFGQCVETCEVNEDCEKTKCCSFGYCSSGSVCGICDTDNCYGRKTVGDVCNKDNECSSLKCVKDGDITLATLEQDGLIHY